MQQDERRLNALAYALGWVVLIAWICLLAAWAAYLGRLAGRFHFLPDTWWPQPEVHLIFIAVTKLMLFGLTLAWIAVLLYRRRLRAP